MVATKGQAITLGVLSILTLGAGIAVMVLFHSLFEHLGKSGQQSPVLSYFWPYGLPVLIVGVLGVIAAAVRNNVAVGIYMGICIVALIVEAAFVVLMGLVLFAYLLVDPQSVDRDCFLINDSCVCNQKDFRTGFSSCEDPVVKVIHFTRAAAALIIVSWLLMLAGSIVSCTACCCGKRTESRGAIIVHGGGQAYQMGQYPSK